MTVIEHLAKWGSEALFEHSKAARDVSAFWPRVRCFGANCSISH
jgi:hypothetical protein